MNGADESLGRSWLGAYRGRRILITGQTGFKGSWLSIWLKAIGAEVHGLSLPAEESSLYREADVADASRSMYGDIRSLDTVSEAFSATMPEIVFHLAAQSLVRRGYADPVGTYATNVMGTVNVLEVARQYPDLRAVVVVTSDKCYENRDTPWSYRETDQIGGQDPYSSSKGCAELVTSAYRRSFFSDPAGSLIASARAGNVIGGGDWSEDRLVPDIVRAITRGQPVVIRNPDSVRPWQHVLEPIRGYLLLGARLLGGRSDLAQEWNFGPTEDGNMSVQGLAETIISEWGDGSISLAPEEGALHEAAYLRLDTTKAQHLLGYRPIIRLPTAIKLAVEWYRQHNQRPERSRAFTEQQIEEYTASLV